MEILNATKLHQQTGASYALIRKLISIGTITPINSSEPYLFSEDAISQIEEYRDESKKTDVPLYPLLKSYEARFDKLEATLQEILSRLNNPQVIYQPQHGNSKAPDPNKERIKELKARQKELQNWGSSSLIQSFSYKRFEELLAVHEELTGDTEVREKFDELDGRLRSFVPEYKRLKEESERTGIPGKLSEYVGWTIMNTKGKWWWHLREYLNIKDPKIDRGTEVFFETPFELELGENLPEPDVYAYLISQKAKKGY